jgi:hypothetical protein
MKPRLPQLSILPADKLLLHEYHDEQRALPLIENLNETGILKNPPIVLDLHDADGHFMVLDGANRVTALRKIGSPHVLAQVIQPDDPYLELNNWNHVIRELPLEVFMDGLRVIPDLELRPAAGPFIFQEEETDQYLAFVETLTSGGYQIFGTIPDRDDSLKLLNAITHSYITQARLDRTSQRQIAGLEDLFHNLTALVVYPYFSLTEVMRLAINGRLLPAGITRFIVSPRALRLNYPLSELTAAKPAAEKNETLNRWVQERLDRKGVRYYAETTYLFDE